MWKYVNKFRVPLKKKSIMLLCLTKQINYKLLISRYLIPNRLIREDCVGFVDLHEQNCN